MLYQLSYARSRTPVTESGAGISFRRLPHFKALSRQGFILAWAEATLRTRRKAK